MRAPASALPPVLALAAALGCRSLPEGRPGPEADALARRMIASVDGPAWNQTRAVRWVFAGKNRHLWDRGRNLAEVKWSEHRVLLRLSDRTGRAWHKGTERSGPEREAALKEAYAKWVNDAFWLNPVVKAFDDGTIREKLPDEDGQTRLLVRYQSGGLTPGDAYLWQLQDDRPVAWRMWTSNLPVKGMRASWEGWQKLSTGAWVATRHETAIFDLELTEVEGFAVFPPHDAPDPFAPLFEATPATARVAPQRP